LNIHPTPLRWTVNFRARYYRLPGPVTGGKVEAAVIVHFVYQ